MHTPLPRQLIAVAISLTMLALMIGGVASLSGISSPQVSGGHCRATGTARVALA